MSLNSIADVADRAASDPGLLRALADDVLGAMAQAGARVTLNDLKDLMQITGATDLEAVETLRLRIAAVAATRGCGQG